MFLYRCAVKLCANAGCYCRNCKKQQFQHRCFSLITAARFKIEFLEVIEVSLVLYNRSKIIKI